MTKKIILDEEVENIEHYIKLITSFLSNEDYLGKLVDHLIPYEENDDKLFEMFNIKKTSTHLIKTFINDYSVRTKEFAQDKDNNEFIKNIEIISLLMKRVLDISSSLDYFIFEIYSSKKREKLSRDIEESIGEIEEIFKGFCQYDFGNTFNGELVWTHEGQQLALALSICKEEMKNNQNMTDFIEDIRKSGKIKLTNARWSAVTKKAAHFKTNVLYNIPQNESNEKLKEIYGFVPESFVKEAANLIKHILTSKN